MISKPLLAVVAGLHGEGQECVFFPLLIRHRA